MSLERKRIIIDTDPGIDDALALIMGMHAVNEIEVLAITVTHGNVPLPMGTQNALTILSIVETANNKRSTEVATRISAALQNVTVAAGADKPLVHSIVHAMHVHGNDGLGNTSSLADELNQPKYQKPSSSITKLRSRQNAIDVMEKILTEQEKPITIVALGPLTNIAGIIQRNIELVKQKVDEIIIMGGAIAISGNITAAAEFNIYCDPHAAKIVLESGLKLILLPIDATHQVELPRHMINEIVMPHCKDDVLSSFVCDCTKDLIAFCEERLGRASLYLHDPVAVGLACNFAAFAKKVEPMRVDVETVGELTRGMTLADRRKLKGKYRRQPNCDVVTEVHVARFLTYFFNTVLQLSTPVTESQIEALIGLTSSERDITAVEDSHTAVPETFGEPHV